MTNTRIPLGQIYITPGARREVPHGEICDAIIRHMTGEFGDLSEADWESNTEALENDGQILSAYDSKAGVRFWIITEGDRSVTTILLPEDY